jgi:hypothetical protein
MPFATLTHPRHQDIEIWYVPDALEESREAGWSETPIPGADNPLLVWQGSRGLDLTLGVAFAGRTALNSAQRLEATTQQGGWAGESAPPVWRLVIGRRVIPVVVMSVRSTRRFWDDQKRATFVDIQISLKRWQQFSISARGT